MTLDRIDRMFLIFLFMIIDLHFLYKIFLFMKIEIFLLMKIDLHFCYKIAPQTWASLSLEKSLNNKQN